MKKKLAAIAILSLLISGCFGGHKIIVETGDEDLVSCPKRAKTGETVTVETVIVSDADLYLIVDGVNVEPIREGYYEFEMPDHDVSIKVVIKSNGLA